MTGEKAATSGEPVVMADAHADPRAEGRGPVRSLVLAPLSYGLNPLGLLEIGHHRANVYGPAEARLIERFARQLALALQLDGLNKDRRMIELGMQLEALDHLHALSLDETPRFSICLYDPAWHQGVIGILAARIKERLHRPVIIFADGGTDADGKLLIKGSARSIQGIHIRDLLDTVISTK